MVLYISCQAVTHEGRDRKPEKKTCGTSNRATGEFMPSFEQLKNLSGQTTSQYTLTGRYFIAHGSSRQ